jgi:hypothetical protein
MRFSSVSCHMSNYQMIKCAMLHLTSDNYVLIEDACRILHGSRGTFLARTFEISFVCARSATVLAES